MAKNLTTAILMTVVTTLLLGLGYPLTVTGLAQVLFPDEANGQLVVRDGKVVGSRLIGQPFSGAGYFHSRPPSVSNLGPTNDRLVRRVKEDVERLQAENPSVPVPIDLVTTSGSGVDPHISPEAADFQVPRVARERTMPEDEVRRLVAENTEGRQLGLLGELRVNVLMLNLALDEEGHR